jgi:glutamate racemase
MIKIGVFDSGIGGLWILKHLQSKLPQNNYIFFADQGHVPYGERSMEEIRAFSEKISQFLVEKDCKIIVIACNTASAAALLYLREKFPETIFVGMEPAIKPAVEITHTKKVGVLATPATFQGELYNSVVERFASDVEIFQNTCPGLVKQIEKGELKTIETRLILERALLPMLEKNIDIVVLGCTHYPFVIPLIKEIIGDSIKIIDPTGAIVKRVEMLLKGKKNFALKDKIGKKDIEILTSGNTDDMGIISSKLLSNNINIIKVNWTPDLKIIM